MPPKFQLANAVEILAAQLTSLHIPKEAIRKAAEHVRILETRVKTGSLGKTDRPNTRAAVLLELAYRQITKSRLPWELLASAVHAKVLQLEQLQQSLNNYLQEPSSTRTTLVSNQPITEVPRNHVAHSNNNNNNNMEQRLSSQVQAIRKQIAGQKRPLHLGEFRQSIEVDARRRSSRTKTPEADSQRMEDLAIRVQILDSSQAWKRAKQFFDDMTKTVANDPSLSESDRRGQLYDFVRYGPAYEAAALFCVADGDVQLEDLVKASTEFTRLELKQVLPFVKDAYQKLKHQNKTRKKNVARDVDGARNNVMEVDTCIQIDQDLEEQEKARELEEEARFVKWRQLQLETAMEQARIRMSDDPTMASTTCYSDSEVLAFAADEILCKYGLLTKEE